MRAENAIYKTSCMPDNVKIAKAKAVIKALKKIQAIRAEFAIPAEDMFRIAYNNDPDGNAGVLIDIFSKDNGLDFEGAIGDLEYFIEDLQNSEDLQ